MVQLRVLAPPADSRELSGEERKLVVLVLIVVALLLARLFGYELMHPLLIGHDNALHLQIAQLMLEGKMLYVDIIDVNLPMIYYLSMVPAGLSNVLNIPVPLAYNLFVACLVSYCVLGSAFLLLRRPDHPNYKLFPFVLFGLCSFNLLLHMDYGQREHLFLILFFPYFVLRWLRWNGYAIGKKEGYICGFLAAAGVCLKHYFIVPVIAVELFWCLEKGTVKPLWARESLTFVLTGVVYLIHFAFMPEAMKTSYFGMMLPAFQLGYQFWDVSFAKNLMSNWSKSWVCGLVLLSGLAVIAKRRFSLLLPLVVFGLSSLVIYLMQFKGWLYQRMPFLLVIFLLTYIMAGFLFWKLWTKLEPKFHPTRMQLAVAASVCAFIGVTYSFWRGTMDVYMGPPFQMSRIGYSGVSPADDLSMMLQRVMAENVRLGETVVVLANGVAPAYPTMTQLRIKPGSRYPHVCILSVLEYIKTRWDTPEAKRLVAFQSQIINDIGSDILKNRPKLVIVQRVPLFDYIKPFDFLKRYMQHYEEVARVEGYVVYRLKEGSQPAETLEEPLP